VTIGVEALWAAVRGIKSLFDGFRRQPAWLQLAIAGALAAAVIHPRSRAKLLQVWNSACVTASQVKGPMFEGFVILMQQVAAAQSEAIKTHRQIQDRTAAGPEGNRHCPCEKNLCGQRRPSSDRGDCAEDAE
jgi:hypothetical protein